MSQERSRGQGSGVKGQGYRQLLVWRKAHALALGVFRATQSLPAAQGWLRSQCARAAVSVAANIAEGYSRGSLREYIQFLNIARGSLAETEYYLLFMRDAGLLSETALRELDAVRTETANLLLGLIRSLQAREPSRVRSPRRIGDEPAEYLAVLAPDNGDLDP